MNLASQSSYVAMITAELKAGMPRVDMLQLSIPSPESPSQESNNEIIENRVTTIANDVALKQRATRIPYSNFHTWNYFRNFKTEQEVREHASSYPAAMLPFKNCLSISHQYAEALKTALRAESDLRLRSYADRVELATDNWEQKATNARNYHCVVMMRFWNYALLIDLISLDTLTKVPLNSITPSKSGAMAYAYIAIGSARLLVDYHGDGHPHSYSVLPRGASRGNFMYRDPYRAIKGGLEAAVVNLAWPSVRYPDLPSRRAISLDSVWNYAPTVKSIPYVANGDGTYTVTVGCLRIDFFKRSIQLDHIPNQDWLKRPENDDLRARICAQEGKYGRLLNEDYAEFVVRLHDCTNGGRSQRERDRALTLSDLCEALGLPKVEFMRIIVVMVEVLHEEDECERLKIEEWEKAYHDRRAEEIKERHKLQEECIDVMMRESGKKRKRGDCSEHEKEMWEEKEWEKARL